METTASVNFMNTSSQIKQRLTFEVLRPQYQSPTFIAFSAVSFVRRILGDSLDPMLTLPLQILLYFITKVTYNICFHPLAAFPGPFWARASLVGSTFS